ncbi:two-component system, OmpR family, heavy metal sensor histidine kinase CusS, partial [Enterobacter hormaechei]
RQKWRQALTLNPVSYTHLDVYKRQLNGYFDNQDRDFLTGKLQLTEEFLKTETFRNKTDIKSLSEKINDAMVGHLSLIHI